MAEEYTFALEAAQDEIKKVIQAHSWFAHFPIITEKMGDIPTEIEKALGTLSGVDGQIGLCLVVLTPKATIRHQNAAGPVLETLDISIGVLENPVLNSGDSGTKKPAIRVVEMLLRYLHRRQITGIGGALCASPRPFALIQSTPTLVYEVYLTAILALSPVT